MINNLNSQIWILAGGRLLLQFGTGFTLFYAPIFFVNQLGFSPTMVGIALGSASVSGILGRFLGGSWSDSPQWGRKKILLLSAIISALADVFLASASNFSFLLLGNLLMGLGIGFYWPPAEALVADLTTPCQRNSAFAISRLADNLGLGLGIIIGGWIIAATNNYRLLFIIDGVSFVVFYLVIHFTIKETHPIEITQQTKLHGWHQAFKDKSLWIFCVVNVMFTTYISQIQTTLPLYLTNFTVNYQFSIANISSLFSLHIIFAAILQLPILRILNRLNCIQGLTLSLIMWGISFSLIWATGNMTEFAFYWAISGVLMAAMALITYNPPASALIVDLAPVSLRGIYFAINSQCWAIGYLIGPPLGGWVLDQGIMYAHNFWLILASSIFVGVIILQYLKVNLIK
ncbi:major facilitator superfamily protein [Geminocystis sp. NIES-3708]|uniref:MFS transporter n=1 Tax=Geminocystis sp. NIES-3708 TaxID=1615909 RepID=UPI0005FC781A|nr:MFS transporter [Geminocystis sp. NIES-3708]BAQ61490.1 major facilitator superfamily protein [Geminocystis sp. NIES-3708]